MSPASQSTSAWICSEFARILGIPAAEDLATYLMSMECSRDVEDYLQSMLDMSDRDHLRFMEDLLHRLGHSPSGPVKAAKSSGFPSKQPAAGNVPAAAGKTRPPQQQAPPSRASKAKAKQVNLFSAEGKARQNVILPGQHWCECQATKHALVRNCLDCGRVICAQEGTGPCLFCTSQGTRGGGGAAEVKAAAAAAVDASTTSKKSKQTGRKKSDAAKVESPAERALMTAMAHKEKLLEYDRTSEQRTRVIDDESDYFNADGNRWLDAKQKEALRSREKELRAKRFGSRREMKVTLDFSGRQVIEEASDFHELFTEQKLMEDKDSRQFYDEYVVNPVLDFPRPVYESYGIAAGGAATASSASASSTGGVGGAGHRLQDAELQKMSDQGKCLSLHQPYASLLVAGIKKHEGRTWYSSHRGRLWIASTVKPAADDDIRQLEDFYRRRSVGGEVTFPRNYPTGCLLGCVEVVDVLPQEEYRLQHPHGESESPYVFVCASPHELFIKFPVKGQHKIYCLEPAVHRTAKKSLAFDTAQ